MKHSALILFLVLLTTQCIEKVSSTFFFIQNDLKKPIEINFSGVNNINNEQVFLKAESDTLICSTQRMDTGNFAPFEWILNCHTTIHVFYDGIESKKEFNDPSEWTFRKKNNTEVEYRLRIDSDDF